MNPVNVRINFAEMDELFKARFWSKVTVQRSNSKCWIWTAASLKSGYGIYKIDHEGQIVQAVAHHIAWSIANNKAVPEGKIICHTCDTPRCVNPFHLWTGSHRDNSHDMIKKLRSRYPGPKKRKLTDEQHAIIRDDPRKYREIAAEYGISAPMVCHIKKRRSRRPIHDALLSDAA